MMGKTADDVHFRVLSRLVLLLGRYGWDKMGIGIGLMKLETLHGKSSVESMERYLDWAVQTKASDISVCMTVAHDLKGCDRPQFTPRTAAF